MIYMIWDVKFDKLLEERGEAKSIKSVAKINCYNYDKVIANVNAALRFLFIAISTVNYCWHYWLMYIIYKCIMWLLTAVLQPTC